MKKAKRCSVTPIYLSAAVWLLAAMFLPMYRLWHYIAYAAAAAAAYLIGNRLFPPVVEEIPIPEAKPDTGDAQTDEAILSGRESRDILKKLGMAIRREIVSDALRQLSALTGKILTALEEEPSRTKQARKFLSYYLPTTVTLFTKYQRLEQQDVLSETREKIEAMLPQIQAAFQAQLSGLYKMETLDISADLAVMQHMMQTEGILDSEL